MYCHQDCLEEWLQHSRKDHCELCKTQYQFIPIYAEGAPDSPAMNRILVTMTKKFFLETIPFALRLVAAAILWLLVVPILTSCLHRFWIHGNRTVDLFDFNAVWNDIVSGFVLAGMIALSFIVLVRH